MSQKTDKKIYKKKIFTINKILPSEKKNNIQTTEQSKTLSFTEVSRVNKLPYKKRISRNEYNDRIFYCQICLKRYSSYQAIYIHLRNIHQIETDKIRSSFSKKEKKHSLQYFINLKNNIKEKKFEIFENNFKIVYNDVFFENKSNYSQFIENLPKNYGCHPVFECCLILKNLKTDRNNFNPVELITNIDYSLAIYILDNFEIDSENKNVNLIKNLLLFRVYLNLAGVEYVEDYKKYEIIRDINLEGEYCNKYLADDVPLMCDDFLGVFLNFESQLLTEKDVSFTILDFCNFLFMTKQTYYKLDPL